MTAVNVGMSNVRLITTSLTDAADQYEHAVADVESGCCAGEHCPCDGSCHHAGRSTQCVACEEVPVERAEIARMDLVRLIVKAGLADAVAEAAAS